MVKVEASEDTGGMADIAQVRVVHVIESTVRCNCGQLLGRMAPGTGMHVGSLAPPMKFESNSDCGAALTYVSVCIGISSQCACTVALWLALLVAMLNAASGRHGSDDACSAFSGTNFSSWPSGQTENLPFGPRVPTVRVRSARTSSCCLCLWPFVANRPCTTALWLAPPIAMVNAAAGRHVSDDDCSAFSGTNFSWPSGQIVNLPVGSEYQQ